MARCRVRASSISCSRTFSAAVRSTSSAIRDMAVFLAVDGPPGRGMRRCSQYSRYPAPPAATVSTGISRATPRPAGSHLAPGEARRDNSGAMRSVIALVLALAIAFGLYYFYLNRIQPAGKGSVATQAISITGVQNDL